MAGRIDRLTIHNFKSYKSTHVVGPFDSHFTSVIGPNGSGKSNLMDAISFVVGVRSSHLRSGQVSELVTTGEKNAYVSLAFVQPNGNEIVFRRDIKNAQATYSIDGKTVTSAAYLDRLASFGVHTKTRNFLVFQGDVEQVAPRGPHELVQLFEHISGADALVPRYDELEAECTSLEAVTQYAFGKRKGVMLEKKQKKEQAEEADKFNSLKEELAEQRAKLALVQPALPQERAGGRAAGAWGGAGIVRGCAREHDRAAPKGARRPDGKAQEGADVDGIGGEAPEGGGGGGGEAAASQAAGEGADGASRQVDKEECRSAQKTRGGASGSQGGRRKIGDGPRQDSGCAQ